ncbi:MAG TPA: AraC family transcriptional regulator [Puia sp.]|nr:AraC family transcriptional regulator [Puia sp.]
MLLRFPPIPPPISDPTFLTSPTATFAKHKIETQAGKRTVFLTEHTVVFVLEGTKFLHLPERTITVAPHSVVLVKKGIYAMAEYIVEGLTYEALMIFLSAKTVKTMAWNLPAGQPAEQGEDPFVILPSNEWLDGFKQQYRNYFGKIMAGLEDLLTLKQEELLLLLLASDGREKIISFLRSANRQEPEDLEYIVRTYLFQPITLTELAGLSNRSLASFKRDFQRLYGCSPKLWINRQRLAHAQLLLHNTHQQVAEIAFACGFESVSHFIRIFRKEYGLTPQAMRTEKAIL